jgi:predicted ArsR family transcriptional regulator
MSELEDAGRHAALASPVRQRVLDVLGGAADALTAQQLAGVLGLHVSTLRFHLEQLEDAGLVVRETRHSPRRGRPSVVFRAPGLDAGRARDRMIEALADAAASPDRASAPLVAGRRWAEQLPMPAGTPGEAIASTFARLGFGPELAGDTVRLRSCPFRDAARRHPDVVCRVHLGLAQGLARRAAPGDDVQVGLQPFVEQELCLLTLRAPGPGHDD